MHKCTNMSSSLLCCPQLVCFGCPPRYFVQHPNPNRQLDHSKFLVQPFARTDAFFHSFFVDIKLGMVLPVKEASITHYCVGYLD